MPRLGTGGTRGNGGGGTPRRPAASAYPALGRGGILSNVMFLLAFTFILRNVFFHDYRSEEIKELEAMGKTPEQIEKLVPKTSSERRAFLKKKRIDDQTLTEDVELLKKQVAEMREKLGMDDETSPSVPQGDEQQESKAVGDAAEKQQKEGEKVDEETETTERRAKKVSDDHEDKPQHSHHSVPKEKTRHASTEKPAKPAVTKPKTSPAKKKKKGRVQKKKVVAVSNK